MAELTDADLVAGALQGDREAFSLIVVRYQTLVCSLAYNVLGNLGESEDAAQETFIIAWKRLRHLREPSKLRSWLCGIVNHRAHDCLRRERREPARGAEALDTAEDTAAPDALPSERVIGEEEQAILWRALNRVPPIYREPMILFYREHNSVERVAAELELSEDAVKQRLARGRKALHEEVVAFVEETLRQTAPGRAFTENVLSALPLGPGLMAAGGLTAAGKGAFGKAGALLAAITGSIIYCVGMGLGLGAQWLILRATPSQREKRGKMIWFGVLWVLVLAAWCIEPLWTRVARAHDWSDRTTLLVMAISWWTYAVGIATFGILIFRWVIALRRHLAQQSGEPIPPQSGGWTKALLMSAFVYGANVLWLAMLAWQAGDFPTAWLVIAASVALVALHFTRLRGKNRDEALVVHAGQMAMQWALVLVTLNLRMDSWLAARRGIDISQLHTVFSPWTIPMLSLALLCWAGVLLASTRRFDVGPVAVS